MSIYRDLLDWYKEQKQFKEAEDYFRELEGKPKQTMLNYIANDFKELVIEPTKEDYRDTKQSIKKEFIQINKDILPHIVKKLKNRF